MKKINTITVLLAVLLAGCHARTSSQSMPPVTEVAPAQGAAQQSTFQTPEQAADFLIAAAKSQNRTALRQILGPELDQLFSGDPVQDTNALQHFSQAAAEQHRLEQISPTSERLVIGTKNWPYPIPLVKRADGNWFFDTHAGVAEILARRIGRDELETIATCRAYVVAQREYASQDRNHDDVLEYAQHFISDPGRHNGLYWPVAPNEEQSPLGPLVARAAAEGYRPDPQSKQLTPYHGYYYRILTRQGSNVPGGAYDYIINGHMIAGFALVASPAKYGSSGIMTFVVNHRGRVYQKDLGPKTDSIARAMTTYNPDRTWTFVKDQ